MTKSILQRVKLQGFWLPIAISLVAAPLALGFGFLSAGAGEGNYLFAKLLFPYTMLSTVRSELITLPWLAVAVIQFPFYGFALAVSRLVARTPTVVILMAVFIVAVHVSAVVLSLIYVSENFS